MGVCTQDRVGLLEALKNLFSFALTDAFKILLGMKGVYMVIFHKITPFTKESIDNKRANKLSNMRFYRNSKILKKLFFFFRGIGLGYWEGAIENRQLKGWTVLTNFGRYFEN